MRLRKTNFLFGLVLWLLVAAGTGHAQNSGPSEYQLKAAFLYNFAKFVDWPPETLPDADKKSPFIIGVLGANPFGSDLTQMVAKKEINGHPITIKTFRAAAEATNCHILFVSNSEKTHFAEIVQVLHGSAVLTVGEAEQFIDSGGMVNFVKESSKIRFQINAAAAKTARLKISSKLLSLAINSPR